MRYIRPFTKTVWGWIETDAKNATDAEKKFEDGEYDEFDNKSDYEYGEWKQD